MSSARLGAVIAEQLAAAGVGDVVVCPGSRSTAVAVALSDCARAGALRLHTRTDERSAAFLALGLARARGAAAIVVTSGTAVGNLLPAIMEARHSGVPLVVVTADRPATLLGSGSNQTTEQRGLFANHVVADLQLASTDDDVPHWRAGLGRVLAAARGLRSRTPGPVQINAAFTEPFLGDMTLPAAPAALRVAASRPAESVTLSAGPRTVVLAGDAPVEVGRRARGFAEAAGLPLLAEPSSNARGGGCAIVRYRELLDSALGQRIERVVLFGHPTLSRPVTRLLSRSDVELVVVNDRAEWPDPGGRAALVCDDVALEAADGGWLGEWLDADASAVAAASIPGEPITGPELAAAVVAAARGNLVLGSSNPIRDADLAPLGGDGVVVWANRGLAGIDGVISTATGVALGTERPATVLLGDLGFLHDVGALHIPASQPVPDLRVVVADDDGGGIFRTLEVAGADWFEPLFAMPHGRDLAAVAAGFGWPVHKVTDRADLAEHLTRPVAGLEVLIVPIDPRRSAAR